MIKTPKTWMYWIFHGIFLGTLFLGTYSFTNISPICRGQNFNIKQLCWLQKCVRNYLKKQQQLIDCSTCNDEEVSTKCSFIRADTAIQERSIIDFPGNRPTHCITTI